jgi:hypothetical protein
MRKLTVQEGGNFSKLNVLGLHGNELSHPYSFIIAP